MSAHLGMLVRPVDFVWRSAIGDNCAVTVVRGIGWWSATGSWVADGQVPYRTVVAWRLWQLGVESLRAFDVDFAPDEFLHRLFGSHPWSTSFTPTWGTEDRHLEAEAVSFFGSMSNCCQPLRGAEYDL